MYPRDHFSKSFIRTLFFLIIFLAGTSCQANPSKESKENHAKRVVLHLTTSQHALVVGIDKYQAGSGLVDAQGIKLTNLEGAVNDAKLLTKALRDAKIQLPDQRILLNEKATRANFLQAWRQMVKQAKFGDTLIITFAGHGLQYQSDIPPKDEKDHKDEGLIFYDFNPNQSLQGDIIDDELYGLFKAASDYKIVLLVDACHSRGMVRSLARPTVGRVRTSGLWNITPDIPKLAITQSDQENLAYVTYITAVHSDNLTVSEVTFADQAHGALSWYFAQALNGAADSNQNGYLERNELNGFLTEKIRNKTHGLQHPKLLPRADMHPVIKLPAKATITPPSMYPHLPNIAIVVEHTHAPKGLKYVRLVNSFQTFDLLFAANNQQIEVFNNTGDKITTFSANTNQHLRWQRLIDKQRLLKLLETQFDMRLKPIHITLREGDKLHKKEDKLHFTIAPGDKQQGLNALTVFDLAGDGELQFLYPLTDPKFNNPLTVQQFPHPLPPMEVIPPFGGDDLVVLLCETPATGLHLLLKQSQPKIPDLNTFLSHLHQNRCQVGQYAFFSGE